MDILEYAESVSEKTLEVARKSYDDLHERAYKLGTVLGAGAGAIGAYALGKVSDPNAIIQWAPLGTLSVAWFLIVGMLLRTGLTSRAVSPGNGPANIRSYFKARLSEQVAQIAETNQEELDAARLNALKITREAELDLRQSRLARFIEAGDARARAVDRAYRQLAWSPIAPLVTIGLLKFLCLI